MNLVERRAFPRHPINHLTVLRLADETAIPARIVEASARGLRVELDRQLATDTPVRLSFEGEILLGRVCYCTHGNWSYTVGVYLEQKLEGIEDLAHLSQALAVEEPHSLTA